MSRLIGVLSNLDSIISRKEKKYYDEQELFIDDNPDNKHKSHVGILDKKGNLWDVDYITSKGIKIKF
jgi:hypothetical protein